MTSMKSWIAIALISFSGAAVLGCSKTKPQHLAPTATSLEPSKPPASMKADQFAVDTGTSSATFEMDAPIEKIYGDAPGSVSGDLYVNPKDITHSMGLIKIDLLKMTLYHEKMNNGAFGKREKSDKQNDDAQLWLQISKDAPPATREMFRYAEFKITKVDAAQKDVTALQGATRKLDATVTGDFLIHGHKTTKTAKLELTFQMAGDKVASVHVKSLGPIVVGLEENDIRPRQTWEKLAAKTLGALGQKVAGQAPVMIDFTAKAK
jgi:hypothetical protein